MNVNKESAMPGQPTHSNPGSTVSGGANFIPSIKETSDDLPTTGEVLATDERFSTLLTALGIAFPDSTGLDPPFTVFAPTNAAFSKLDPEVLAGLLEDIPALTTVLLRHVVAEQAVRIPAGDSTLESVGGDSISIRRDLDDIFSENVQVSTTSGTAKVVQFDIITSDGVIHAIDTVI